MAAIPSLRSCAGEVAWAVVTSAFIDDPVERWLYPDDESYARAFPDFARALGGGAIAQGTAWCSEQENAVAVWLPPGVSTDDEQIVSVLTSTVAAEKHDDMFAALEQMSAQHPSEPHWYLAWLAVAKEAQGGGLGDELLASCLTHVDATRMPAYLETPNPRTVAFYARRGFRVVGQTDAGACPPITFMARAVQAS